MNTIRRSTIGSVLVVSVLALCANAMGQRAAGQRPITSMSLPVSSSVLATIVTVDRELMLLVLWRGKKGWHSTGSPWRQSGGGRNGTFAAALQYGDVHLDLRFDPAEFQATVQGKRVSMPHRSNILLVDGVDGRAGFSSVRTLALDPANANLDPRKGSLAPLLGRSPEIVSFLRCDEADREFTAMPCHELVKR